MITHIVFFKLSNPTAETMTDVCDKLLSMQGKIPQLRHLEAGADIVHSERSYDIALVTRFDSAEDLQSYQVHPYHEGEVIPLIKSTCSGSVTVDYES